MQRRLRIVAIAAFAALVPTLASAQVPNPAQSTLDGDLSIGNARGLPVIPLANVRPTVTDGYRIIVRDLNAVPIAGAQVVMDFAGSGVRVHAGQTSGQASVCPNLLTKTTNAAGEVIFYPATVGIFASINPGVQIRANNVILGSVRFRSVDLVATPGGISEVDGQDIDAFRRRFLGIAGESPLDPETDFATEGPSFGTTDAFDLNVLRVELLCGTLGAPIPEPCTQPACP